MLSKKGIGAFLFAALVSQPTCAGVISGVLTEWNAHADTCEDGQLDLKAVVNVAMFESINAIAGKYTPTYRDQRLGEAALSRQLPPPRRATFWSNYVRTKQKRLTPRSRNRLR